MVESESGRDLSQLVVSRAGGLVATGDEREPYRLVDAAGLVVESVSGFLRELKAMGRCPATLRSYGMDLLRWWRFLEAVGIGWDRALRVEARDFSCWIGLTVKQRLQTSRPHAARWSSSVLGTPNPVTGKPGTGDGYAPASIAHSETVSRRFYDFHRDGGSGPIINPFPLDLGRRSRRAHAHHNRCNSGARSVSGGIGRRCRGGCRARSPMTGSTNCSRGCRRTAIGVGGVLDLYRCAGLGAARGASLRCPPGRAIDQRGA